MALTVLTTRNSLTFPTLTLLPRPLSDLFFRFDPLMAAAAMLSGRSLISRLALAAVTLALLGCNACGQLCPSGAIPALDLESKRQAVIGIAVIDRNRCLPWARGMTCIVCEEMCQKPDKAIRLEEAEMPDGKGEPIVVQRPYVLQDLCIGCGICERQCPAEGKAAIQVYRRT